MDLLNGMLQKDQDEFRRICNKLINVCFICRQNQATRSDFYFIQKYKEKFEELLGVLGYRLEINEEYGVVHFPSSSYRSFCHGSSGLKTCPEYRPDSR